MITIGKKIPAFKAIATSGNVSLSDYSGKQLVLYFYPKDNTPGCTQETIEFRDAFKDFKKAGAIVVGVSRDSLKSHENFKAKLELPFELISDPEEVLCELFGVMKLKNMYGKQVRGIERSTFLVSADSKLLNEWRGVKVLNHVQTVLDAVKAA
jgi:thioredoxin-dependent peroxiredoxin